MEKIYYTKQLAEFINLLLKKQIDEKVYYSYMFINNNDYDFFNLEKFKNETKKDLKHHSDKEAVLNDLRELYSIIDKNMQLFEKLHQMQDNSLIHKVCTYTYSSDSFVFSSPININECKNYNNHNINYLWDFCYNVGIFIEPIIGIDEAQNPTGNKIKDFIINEFNNMDGNKNWQFAFSCENDLNTFVDILTNYFENKPYTLPDNIIELNRNTKMKFSIALHEILKKYSSKANLSDDTEFIKIINTTIKYYNTMKDNEIYKSIVRA